MQVHELRRYREARGWHIEQELVGHGFSGGTEARPALKQLINLVRERKVDVVVKDNIDYTTPAGRLLAQILGSLAEFEKSLLIERTMLGLEHARRSGKTLGRPKLRNDAKIIELRNRGLSYTAIQKELGISRGAVARALQAVPKTPKKSAKKTHGFQWS